VDAVLAAGSPEAFRAAQSQQNHHHSQPPQHSLPYRPPAGEGGAPPLPPPASPPPAQQASPPLSSSSSSALGPMNVSAAAGAIMGTPGVPPDAAVAGQQRVLDEVRQLNLYIFFF